MRGKCIICENDADGAPIADSRVIWFIRAVKQRLGIAKNNTLIVCPACQPIHEQKRKKFERKLSFHAVIAALLIIGLVLVPIGLGAPFSLPTLILSPILGFAIILLALTEYAPPLAEKMGAIPLENEKDSMRQAIAPAYPTAEKESHAPAMKKASHAPIKKPARHAPARKVARKR
jgi:hypothetical protein